MMPVALLYAGGVLLGGCLDSPLRLLLAAGLGCALAGLAFERVRTPMLAASLMLAGWANMTWRTAPLAPHDLRHLTRGAPEEAVLRGRLRGVPSQRVTLRDAEDRWRTLAVVEVEAVRFRGLGWEAARGRVQTATAGVALTNWFDGQEVEVAGVLAPPPRAPAPGLFDYRAWLARRGIHHELRVESPADWRARGGLLPAPWTARFRQWAQGALALGLPERDHYLELQWAMLLGWKTGLREEVSEPFMRSGTMHVFAISGLHIALLAAVFLALFSLLGVPRAPSGLGVIALIWFYTAATEWQPSAVRSSIMMTVVLAGWALKRPANLLNSLGAAALLILLGDPAQLFQAGFQLSFGAVLGLAIIPQLHERAQRHVLRPLTNAALTAQPGWFSAWWTWLLPPDPFLPADLQPAWQHWLHRGIRLAGQTLLTSLAATLGTAPLIACHFHLFSPVSLLVNAVVVPLSGLALASGVGGLLCAGWLPWAAAYFNHAGWWFMSRMAALSHAAAAWPGAWWNVAAPPPLLLALYYAGLLAIVAGWFHPRSPWTRLAALAVVASTGLAAALPWLRPTRLTILPASHGLVVWADAPGRANDWLIDCGNALFADQTTIPLLRSRGVNRLAHFALTHGDVQHVGGATNVMREFRVGEVLTGPLPMLSQPYRQALAFWTNHHRPLRLARSGDRAGPWTVLHPNPGGSFAVADDKALTLLGQWRGARLLLCPDLGPRGQEALLVSTQDLRADILVITPPQEGSFLPDALLERVRPRLVLLGDTPARTFSGREREAAARLRRSGIESIPVSERGAVEITVGRRGWSLHAAAE